MDSVKTILPRDANAVVRFAREQLQHGARTRSRNPGCSVTLSYAQSLDGSIAMERGKPFQLSNPHSQALTHHLRSAHDAVLVGINTVISDDPQLNVRLVPGKSPRPVVLDSHLRFPLSARLLRPPCVQPMIVTTTHACPHREQRLRDAGARIVRVPPLQNGFIDVGVLLTHLEVFGVRSLMVEGGATVITSFLASDLVDQLIVTIVPRVLGGLPAVTPAAGAIHAFAGAYLSNVHYHVFAGDLVVCAEFDGADPVRQRRSPTADTELVGDPTE
jgi:3,4-dihydroxy 2-butanone 4-phosphate synthase/GTP cyclohydrolase II